MDSYKSLFDRKEYDLIIKLTKSSSNAEDLFYCISAHLALGHIDEALDIINQKKDILKSELATLMRTHIELLCLKEDFDSAYLELKKYENYPYHSQEVEELLKELPRKIREYEKESYQKGQKLETDLQKLLLSKDDGEVLSALDQLREIDLTPYYIYFDKILTTYPHQIIRTFCLLLLVKQKIDKDIKFNHDGTIIQVNPSKLNPPFVGESFYKIAQVMQESFKDITLSNGAMDILSRYLMMIYPNEIDLEDPTLIEALKIIASEYFNKEYNGINDDKINDLVNEIKSKIENF